MRSRAAAPGLSRRALAFVLVAGVACALLASMVGGLLRAGAALPAAGPWLGAAALDHAALMICCFMGSVIGVERAVALRRPSAWCAPALSAAAGLALLAGQRGMASGLLVAAAAAFVAGNAVIVRRQAAAHTLLLLAAAVAWLAGNSLFAAGAPPSSVLPWWFAFLLGTIAAERLEMTRVLRRRPGVQPALWCVLALLAGGAAWSAVDPLAGGLLYGLALLLLAGWLLAFDVARRTVFAQGLPRYMAACLLGGYGWLAAGGVAWMGMAAGLPLRDAAFHAVGLGFVFSMMLAHAPVILPAVTGIKLAFGPLFYLPLVLLHASLFTRLVPGFLGAGWRTEGAIGNAAAIACFAAVAAGGAWAWRRKHPQSRRGQLDAGQAHPPGLP